MKLLRLFALFALGTFALFSCHRQPTDSPASSLGTPETVLNVAQPVVTVEQVNYTATVFPYRDFMPVRGGQERGLIAIAQVCRSDSLEIPQSLHLKRIWVFHGRERWFAQLGEERQHVHGNFCLEAVARDGPKWEPGANVEVVIGFTVGDSERYLIRTATTKIERTD